MGQTHAAKDSASANIVASLGRFARGPEYRCNHWIGKDGSRVALKVENAGRISLDYFVEGVYMGAIIIERDSVRVSIRRNMNECARSGKDILKSYRLLVAPGSALPGVEYDPVLAPTNSDIQKDFVSLCEIEACAIKADSCIGCSII